MVNSNVVKGTTNYCTWLQIIEELAEKQIFKVIINKKMHSTLVFQYSKVIDMKSWTRPRCLIYTPWTRLKMCNQTEEML